MNNPRTWSDRYKEREHVNDHILLQPFEWHDDKPSETACNMAVQTQPGDLTTYGSPLPLARHVARTWKPA